MVYFNGDKQEFRRIASDTMQVIDTSVQIITCDTPEQTAYLHRVLGQIADTACDITRRAIARANRYDVSGVGHQTVIDYASHRAWYE